METQLALLTHHPCCAWIPPPLQRADNKCVGWHLCPEKAMDVSPSLAELVRNMMIAVYVAAFPAGGSVPSAQVFGPFRTSCLHHRAWGNPLPADSGPFPLFHRTRMFLFVTSVAGDTSGTLLQGGLGLWLCCYFVRVYVDSPGAGRTGPGGVGGTTTGAVVPGVEHAGNRVRLPGP